ncbi:MAG: haloacid dehalogenase type II [Verrucomicrobia bacterium]|nr:haloacid dehalogenase type II [Verrucomicrobiota bacterium]MBV8483122.1 haloacid dehalogenase type II [Verrucomicrobiota bacterium]
MSLNRRQFLNLAASGVATSLLVNGSTRADTPPTSRAIAFDAFTIFDARPITALAEEFFPGRGTELTSLWRTRQFEYTWLRTLYGRYADFWQVTQDSLEFAAKMLKVELTGEKRERLMNGYLELKAFPDVSRALQVLKDAGLRLAFLANLTPQMLDAATKSSKLEGIFEYNLSTDAVKVYKPDARAYQMAIDAFKLPREEIVFAAFGGWDAAGAKNFGYPTFWVNRLNLPVEQLDVVPDGIGTTLTALVDFVKAMKS